MKKLILAIGCLLFFVSSSWSQTNPLQIQGGSGKFYLTHSVQAKENWYSVGRLYNIGPKDLAPYNGLSIDKPLNIGEQVRIPLTESNFTQKGVKGDDESLVPIYHMVQDKEWMFRISSLFNDVSVSSLEKWNHINRDQVKSGMQLIIGYLKVKTAQSALSGGVIEQTAAVTVPVAKEPVKTVDAKPVAVPVVPVTSTMPADKSQRVNTYSIDHKNGGYFSVDFTGNNKSLSGTAATFKSTSGWTDGKYYALMNNLPVGTIVKISNSTAGKSIFAKVLGPLPDMKESIGLDVRISNAAAGELGMGEGKFPVDIKY